MLRRVLGLPLLLLVPNLQASDYLTVDTRGGTQRIDRKSTVVRVAFHQGVILGIESTGNKE
jgi:hypothetical protein